MQWRPLMSNALIMTGRSLRLSARSPEALLTALMLPVMLMVVFVYLFGGAVDIGTRYVSYVVPGVLLPCAVTGAATTAVTVCQDMTGGIIDRFRSLDVPGTAVLAGHVTASLLRHVVATPVGTAGGAPGGPPRGRAGPVPADGRGACVLAGQVPASLLGNVVSTALVTAVATRTAIRPDHGDHAKARPDHVVTLSHVKCLYHVLFPVISDVLPDRKSGV